MNIKETIKNYLQKIPAFISGFILGVILTGAFFLFKINEYIIHIKEILHPPITIVEKQKKLEDTNVPHKKKNKKINNELKDTNNLTAYMKEIDTNIEINQKETTTIAEERTISEKKVRIINLNTPADTTFSNLADAPQYFKDGEIKIIFKKTPFNNKGYYFEDLQLILYGLEDIPYINIYQYKHELYMKYDKVVFKLPFSHKFQPLIKEEDEQLLAKMN